MVITFFLSDWFNVYMRASCTYQIRLAAILRWFLIFRFNSCYISQAFILGMASLAVAQLTKALQFVSIIKEKHEHWANVEIKVGRHVGKLDLGEI